MGLAFLVYQAEQGGTITVDSCFTQNTPRNVVFAAGWSSAPHARRRGTDRHSKATLTHRAKHRPDEPADEHHGSKAKP
jgi:hypothetical protein